MAFIDIFNFKKYFATPSDSQVARYGHVNALYNATQPKFTVDTVTQTGSITTDVTVNSTAGKVTMSGPISAIPTGGFVVNNTEVTSNSIILITAFPQTADRNSEILLNCSDITNGSFKINAQLAGVGTVTSAITINFLVINP
jgi:hypothetical protein